MRLRRPFALALALALAAAPALAREGKAPHTGALGLFEEEIYDDLGPGAGIAICDYNHGNEGLAGGAMLANEFIRLPYQFVTGFRPPNLPRWAKAHKVHFADRALFDQIYQPK